ncbi:uncharacterized protein MYCFIDRAFT_25499 [Pseudocercospora fijiensis CIRAD86]|uniref:Bromodomain associated domain-containing protein n=1 Tax=Pseudocercospora fijiensis (strain CIRAD86) TaxID=383855 RepID=N1Q5X9_PSEFD|nr:uncharacterized protein MYCFIDRAFT_25499 [Pseudocercospora fijiensis CIRAD86]EME87464.1 hypothetical protein MYCFIDRAFT_25499 [Pseudocercospora fijiensis CIRAD86]
MSQAQDLHRALLRPAIIHTLRAAGFHSTKPSVLDTLVNLAERHLLLLAQTTAQHAWSSHNDPVPTITDVRMALSDCAVLIPLTSPSEEGWKERMRKPLSEVADVPQGGAKRMQAEKRKRDDEDTKDVREFTKWYDSPQYREIQRVAGLEKDLSVAGAAPVVGVGGSVVKEDDFFTALKKKHGGKVGGDERFQGTVLGRAAEDREVVVEGGPVQKIHEWRPRLEERSTNIQAQQNGVKEEEEGSAAVSPAEANDTAMQEVEAAA